MVTRFSNKAQIRSCASGCCMFSASGAFNDGEIFIVIAVWPAIVSGSFFWNFVEAVKAREEIAFQSAKKFF